MIKNYSNNDKKISMKLRQILKKNYTPVETVVDTNLNSNQTDSQSDFLALRVIDNLIRFNQSFRLSQVPIKANIGKYKKKGSGVKFVGGVLGKEELNRRGIKYKTEQPTNLDNSPKLSFTKYGDVWIHYQALKSLDDKIAKEVAVEAAKEAEAAKIADEVAEADKIAKEAKEDYNSAKAVKYNGKRLKKNFLDGLKKK